MFKLLLRMAVAWGLSVLVTPYVTRVFDRLANRAPKGSFLEETLLELGDRYSSGLVQSFGETVGELVLGSE